VVAVVDGVAMGGGLELVLAADLVVASDTSRFALPEIALGLIPGWGGTQRLVGHLGQNRAKAAILLGEPFGPGDAGGLVTRVSPAANVDATGRDLVDALAARAPLALRAAKAAIAASYDPLRGATGGADIETEHLLRLFASTDGREGIAAFVEKRPAVFVGA
jgi:enoyl-CoA hydratase/carnithine racemase